MAVVHSVEIEDTTRELWAPPPVTVIPVTSAPPKAPKRLTIMSAVVDAVCEIVALGLKSIRAFEKSRHHDALHDRHLAAMRREAVLGIEESIVWGCGHETRFSRIDGHGDHAQRQDVCEDWWIEHIRVAWDRVVQIGRGVNQRLEHEIGKRGGRRG